MTNPVNWFEIPVHDMDRAQRFYQAVFLFELQRQQLGGLNMAWFPMEKNGAGATGTLMQATSYVPSYSGAMVYFSVPDIDATLKRVEAQGGSVITAKMSIGEYGFVGHFEDSEGNRSGLHSMT